MKIGKLELKKNGIEYDEGYWYFFWWYWLPKDARYLGYDTWMCGGYPHASFGFWFFNWSWSFPWTQMNDDEFS